MHSDGRAGQKRWNFGARPKLTKSTLGCKNGALLTQVQFLDSAVDRDGGRRVFDDGARASGTTFGEAGIWARRRYKARWP